MSIAAIVEALVVAGATPEMILAAVRAAEASSSTGLEQRRASDAERQRRLRDRRNVMSRDVTVTERDVTQKEVSPAPLQEKQNHPSKKTPKGVQKGSRLSPDWQPSPEDLSTARVMGFSESLAKAECDRFRDYWIGKAGQNGVKLDWAATLRNWLRSSAERRGLVPMAQGPPAEVVPTFATEDEAREWRFARLRRMNGTAE